MAGFATAREFAKQLGVDRKTLTDLRDRDPAVAEAWERGHGELASELTHILLQHAREGNIVAAIYLTKARLGWREGTPAEGAGTANVQVNIQIPPPMFSSYMRVACCRFTSISPRAAAWPSCPRSIPTTRIPRC
ncbi:MAG: hypothetical protein IIC31_02400 [Chloroflexi bacterium]|nr:hypothetical protein [Chloroflexota bacterium]